MKLIFPNEGLSNLVNENILQERFENNPEIKSIDILLQERMPDNVIITKEKKEKYELFRMYRKCKNTYWKLL